MKMHHNLCQDLKNCYFLFLLISYPNIYGMWKSNKELWYTTLQYFPNEGYSILSELYLWETTFRWQVEGFMLDTNFTLNSSCSGIYTRWASLQIAWHNCWEVSHRDVLYVQMNNCCWPLCVSLTIIEFKHWLCPVVTADINK